MILGRRLQELQRDSRAALGLATDCPIVLTGHQAGIWHAGILAKWLLADVLAARADGSAVQLVVDHDVNDAGVIAYPGVQDARLLTAFLPAVPGRREGPTGLQPPIRVGPAEIAAVPEVAQGLEQIREAMQRHATAPSLAAQTSGAIDSLLDGLVRPMSTIMATRLLATPIGATLLAAMRADPPRCIDAYNAAIAADPHVARPLAPDELPLWSLTAGSHVRRRVRVGDRDGMVAPRALLMTALARLGLCDLFIHGTGGGRYERITEAWIRAWLGVELAPMSVATVTMRIPLQDYLASGTIVTHADLRRVRFDPDSATDSGPSEQKRALLQAINAAPRGSAERRDSYRRMHAHLDQRRASRAEEFARLSRAFVDGRANAASVAVAASRAWPFPLHSKQRLQTLRDSIARL